LKLMEVEFGRKTMLTEKEPLSVLVFNHSTKVEVSRHREESFSLSLKIYVKLALGI
jgi:hypothetical protein